MTNGRSSEKEGETKDRVTVELQGFRDKSDNEIKSTLVSLRNNVWYSVV